MEVREQVISKYFTNIKLDLNHIDLYYVRKSIFDALKDNLEKFKGKVLDVGCGIMPYREVILGSKNVTSYVGLDFENSLYPEYALGKPDIFWNGEIIPLDDNSVDTIIATELFEHCPSPEIVMKEMLRVLIPGGILFFTVPFVWNLHLVPHDEYRYTPFSLKRHLSNAGFQNIQMQALGGVDASLVQMLSIWYRNRSIPSFYKRIINVAIVPIIKKLIKADANVDKKALFVEGSMITGISGTAYK